MAILQLEDGTTYTQLEEISRRLEPLNVRLNYWPVRQHPEFQALLNKPALDDAEKKQVLQELEHYFEQLKQTDGYQSRDLIVLHPDIPNLDSLMAKFESCHTHADDEVRYIIDGEGVFGFVCPDGSQMELTIQPEEYINVPAESEHWFHLTDKKRIKAVRYFITTEGWVPEYTETKIRIKYQTNSLVMG
ncbi:acireductone dioxygenase [Limnoraphis robusta]|uniref:Acireductone dioxygenase n=1 Tax=Limnoraphis robusta CCNP1315 TaxID=3110306 RepID=A0ABU5U3P9_9CYAN|nr:acireductone dioxygenase [Limnoraphis robusta]MEA5521517.1 acireductone dioxygenase [Limnoraphis robusta CCNP1315]MEA5543939.1 acireductone dioxygenase [Limnoraphis robusta CCNP1324]